jgi:hypothetical protein
VALQEVLQQTYYIAGWIAQALGAEGAGRRENSAIGKKLLVIMTAISYSKGNEHDPLLPTTMVRQVQAFGSLKFATKPAFLFVCYLEAICIKCLTLVKQILYGNAILEMLFQSLFANERLLGIFKLKIIGAISMDANMIRECYRIVLHLFLKMRGKDYVRRYMGEQGLGLTKALRTTMAAISDTRFQAGRGSGHADSTQNSAITHPNSGNDPVAPIGPDPNCEVVDRALVEQGVACSTEPITTEHGRHAFDKYHFNFL